MKVRVKFSKEGAMKFIGHLDIMRYFQKAVRRANLPVAYSGGFSPHMIMSFAAPLGVGTTSSGEYFDMELTESMPSAQMVDALNREMADGMHVVSVRQIPEGKAHTGMALVAAADYLVSFREGKELSADWKEKVAGFYAQESIVVLRKTKRNEVETDIRPWIYQMEVRGDQLFLSLSQGSVHNLKPELVVDAFAQYLGVTQAPFALMVHRNEVYAQKEDGSLISLENLGEEIQ